MDQPADDGKRKELTLDEYLTQPYLQHRCLQPADGKTRRLAAGPPFPSQVKGIIKVEVTAYDEEPEEDPWLRVDHFHGFMPLSVIQAQGTVSS